MKISCMIVDDLPASVEMLQKYVERTPYLELKGAITDAIQALHFLEEESVDLIFLDISMPDIDGIEFTRSIRLRLGDKAPFIVFASRYTEYAIQGYELEVIGFLEKPFSYIKFMKAVEIAEKKLRERKRCVQRDYLFIDSEGGAKIKVNFNEIAFIEAYGNYVKIITDHNTYIIHRSMAYMDQQLPEGFQRIHNKHIIALDRIQNVSGNQLMLKEYPNKDFTIGRTFRQEFLKKLGLKD